MEADPVFREFYRRLWLESQSLLVEAADWKMVLAFFP